MVLWAKRKHLLMIQSFHRLVVYSRRYCTSTQQTPSHWHFDSTGNISMVDVCHKQVTTRLATARATVVLGQDVFSQLSNSNANIIITRKGNLFTTAQIAGIQAAKRASEWIPLCHPVPVHHVEVRLELDQKVKGIHITGTIKTKAETGVEMEALTAVSAAALTVYDMCKSWSKSIYISRIELLKKTGGKSGTFEKIGSREIMQDHGKVQSLSFSLLLVGCCGHCFVMASLTLRRLLTKGLNSWKSGYKLPSFQNIWETKLDKGLVSAYNVQRPCDWKTSFQFFSLRRLSDSVVSRGKGSSSVTTESHPVSTAIPMGYADEYFHHVHRWRPGDPSKRTVVYLWLGIGKFITACIARVIIICFIYTMMPSADVMAQASTEVKLNDIPEGSTVSVKWRGKPIFIRHRSDADIEKAKRDDEADLRDPEPDENRVEDPHWLVVIGICTHLGCIPIADAGDYGGWFCPCHGSHYDISGRIRKGPAPSNLEIPPYKFAEDGKLIIG
eukprot:jgi/Galph1/2256/GphlegSOOS_G961.1